MRIIKIIGAVLLAVLCCPEYCCGGAVQVQITDCNLPEELPVILRAAERNNCIGDNFLILRAIRRAENGGPGREFGVLHPRCLAEIARRPKDSLDIQAGWAAATIVKNRLRWTAAGRPGEFIDFLGDKYCPASVDAAGNKNWKANVKYFYRKFKNERIENKI